jgi:hypothetical protein
MTKAYIYSLDPLYTADGKWDYGLLKEIFEKNNVSQIIVKQKFDLIPKTERAFVVITGQENAGKEKIISKQLNNIDRVVLFITGDERAFFDVNKIDHPNISIWVQYPHKKHEKYNKFFLGAPQHLKDNLPNYPVKKYDIYFGGQITHQRRKQLAEVMPTLESALYKPTAGFAQGEKPKEYYISMSSAKVVPCPAGAAVIDTFRFYETIEMLSLPVGDLIDSNGETIDYFSYVYNGTIPLEKTDNWNNLKNILPKLINNYPNNMHQMVCWWIKYKRDFSINIMKDLYE